MVLGKLGLACAIVAASIAQVAMAEVALAEVALAEVAMAEINVDTILPAGHVLHDLAFCDIDGDDFDEIMVVSQDAGNRNVEITAHNWIDSSPWLLRILSRDGEVIAQTEHMFSERYIHNEGRVFSHFNCNNNMISLFFDFMDKAGARRPGHEHLKFRLEDVGLNFIGYDSEWLVQGDDSFVYDMVSINFSTQKMQLKTEGDEGVVISEEWIDLKLAPDVLGEPNYPTSLQDFNYEDFNSWVGRVSDRFGETH